MTIPVSTPDLSGNERSYLLDAFDSSWISSSGRYVNRFESEFADSAGARYAASVANGTVALHLALVALDLQLGDEVIVPALTYVATANSVKYAGAHPVFVDVDPLTWCIDPAKIEQEITPRTKGIVVVHLYGHPCDMDAINDIAKRHQLWVVEDAAEAHFATYKGRKVGSLSTIATFSFYGNKILTSGEGGALTYSDPDLDRRIRMLRSQGMDPQRRYYHTVIGFNYRLTNLACALLCAQLERRAELVARRTAIFDSYRLLLSNVPGINFQPIAEWAVPAPWMFCITIDEAQFGMSRDALAALLSEWGIDSRPFFVPVHLMPPYRQSPYDDVGRFPMSEALGQCGLNLPTFFSLKQEQVEYICATILKARERGKLCCGT